MEHETKEEHEKKGDNEEDEIRGIEDQSYNTREIKEGEENDSKGGEEIFQNGTLLSWEEELWHTCWSFNEEQTMGYPHFDGRISYPQEDEQEEIVWEEDIWNLQEIEDIP